MPSEYTMPLTAWCDKLRSLHLYSICYFIAGFSYRARLVSKQLWSHSHSLNTYMTHSIQSTNLYFRHWAHRTV